MIDREPKCFYSFGDFCVDVKDRILWHKNGEVPLTPKVFDTLLVLIENAHRVVPKPELMQLIWPDSFVEENNLAQNISVLRKVLGEKSDGRSYIQTIPKLGYRFIGDVKERLDSENVSIRHERMRAGAAVAREVRIAGSQGPAVAQSFTNATLDFSPLLLTELPVRYAPETMYARSGDVNIAYQVIGDGPLDLVFVMGWVSHLEYFWREPNFARFLLRLASFSRLILFDKRGTGLSDRVPIEQLPTLEERMDDVRAVMQAAGSERAALCGVSEGGPMCSLFSATYPEKTIALVMIGTYAKRIRDEDYPWAPTTAERQHFFEELQEQWGGPVGLEERAPSMVNDPQFRHWWAEYLRMGASPGAAVALTKMNAEIDVRQVLPTIRVPSLVVHRVGDMCLKVEEGRYVASRIPGAKLVELPGNDHLPFVGDQDALLDEVEEFLTGARHRIEDDRVLATVLFTHFEAAQHRVGSRDWKALIENLRGQAHKEITWFRGREIDMIGDRPLAIFDGPARAIRCAWAIKEYAARLGMQLRAGLHTGECDIIDGKVGGIAAEIGLKVANLAAPNEVLVSNTVKDLVAGSGIVFDEMGLHKSLGVSREWRIFAVRGVMGDRNSSNCRH
jgi:pimeloyl-ACP methyl ester carboxylesterase/DNA-binding winged helix-turn-helix (wHTH) protein/class 3 adenylate cyclase